MGLVIQKSHGLAGRLGQQQWGKRSGSSQAVVGVISDRGLQIPDTLGQHAFYHLDRLTLTVKDQNSQRKVTQSIGFWGLLESFLSPTRASTRGNFVMYENLLG